MDIPDLSNFERDNRIEFRNKTLLQQAFVHRSYLNEVEEIGNLDDNERLEFLGDVVLNFVVSDILYERFSDYREGELTSLRSALVRRDTLARLARQLQLGTYLLLGHGEEESGGRTRPATLCATFEAVLGAFYLDQGIEASHTFLCPLIEQELNRVMKAPLAKDAKSRLQEWSQSDLGFTPRYKKLKDVGPDHAKVFTVQVTIASERFGVGEGRSKREAEQDAAAMALHQLEQNAPEFVPNDELVEKWPLSEMTLAGLMEKSAERK